MPMQGVFSVLPTPFLGNTDIDPASLRRVVDLAIGAGVDGLTALGVTSEVARFTEPERSQVLDIVLKQVAGRVPVVAGTTAEGLRTCIEYSRQAKAARFEAAGKLMFGRSQRFRGQSGGKAGGYPSPRSRSAA